MARVCNQCDEKVNVPYLVHESSMARQERHNKRTWIALIVAVAMLFLSNAAWLWAWMQYDYTSTSEEYIYTQDGEGTNIIGSNNEVDNGAETNNTQENENPN